MRAAGMDDVTSSGSANRPARNSAEVTLVLDNVDRTAPAPLTRMCSKSTRHIEREAGSANGREVLGVPDLLKLPLQMPRPVHIHTGAGAEGQIGELIAAKPVARRALLEEAAGISGLHSRRHEAELRLKAAETPRTRRRHYRAGCPAARYAPPAGAARGAVPVVVGRNPQAEAALFHLRWVAARVAEKETEAVQGLDDYRPRRRATSRCSLKSSTRRLKRRLAVRIQRGRG